MGPRLFPFFWAVLLTLSSCDSKREKERAAAERAALEEIETQLRPKAEKRFAILKGIADASRGESAPIRLGDRPAVKMLISDPGPSFPPPGERGFNGRALPAHDLADLSKPVFGKPLSHFGDRKWLDEGLPALRNPQSIGARSSRDRIKEFLSVRYLAVAREDSYVEPKVEAGSLGTEFKAGRVSATVTLFDLEDGACLGGAKVEATSSKDVKYQYRLNPDYSAKDQQERMVSAVRYDLLKNLQEAVLKALEPFGAK